MIELKIRPEYAELYSINVQSVSLPLEGETLRAYVARSEIGKEENIFPVVNDTAKPWSYVFSDGDVLEIYPMAASG